MRSVLPLERSTLFAMAGASTCLLVSFVLVASQRFLVIALLAAGCALLVVQARRSPLIALATGIGALVLIPYYALPYVGGEPFVPAAGVFWLVGLAGVRG